MRISSTLDQLQNGQRCRQGVWLEQAASPSCCHPCNVGLEMLGFGLSQDFYTNATRLAHFVIWCTAALVGCSCLSTYRFLLQRKNLTSPRSLSAVSMACTTGRRSALALCTYHLGCTVGVCGCRWGRRPSRMLISLLLATQCSKLPSEEKSVLGNSAIS